MESKRKIVLTASILSFFLTTSISFLLNENFVDNYSDRLGEAGEDVRFELWNLGLKLALESPISGVGFGNFQNEDWRNSQSVLHSLGFGGFGSTHNSFIDLVLISGIPGLIVFTLLFYHFFKKSIRYLFEPSSRYMGVFYINILASIFLFSYTGQAVFDKITWLMFGFIYLGFKVRPVV